jgi:hypothetical protein
MTYVAEVGKFGSVCCDAGNQSDLLAMPEKEAKYPMDRLMPAGAASIMYNG